MASHDALRRRLHKNKPTHGSLATQVEDLLVASPATVSRVGAARGVRSASKSPSLVETSRSNDEREPENRRDAGIIYMEPKALGLDVLRESWVTRTLAKCPCFVDTQFTAIMALCFDRYLFTSINFMRAQMSELLPTQDNNLCESLTRLLDCFLEPYCDKEGRDAPKKEVVARAVQQLEARFIFSLVWSVGCTGPNESRARFDLWLRLQLAQFGMRDAFPPEGLVYDYARARRPVSAVSGSSLSCFGPRRGRRGASESARSRRWRL